MATFLVGLTDEILPPLLYKPDYNLQYAELNVGTQKYNLYKDQLESLWADYFNSPLTNLTNIEERENIKKDVEENLAKFAGLNFADIKVYEGIKGLISKISSKKHIINDIAFTRRVGEYSTTLDLLKLSPGTKENNYLTYNPDQRKELERQVREFINLTDKNEIANYKFRDPIYKNYDRIIADYIEDYDAKIVTADVVPEYDESGKVVTYKDGYGRDIPINLLVETKNGKMTLPEWQQMIKDHLMKYHGYGEYLSWKTDLDVDSSLINNGADIYKENTNKKNELRFKELWKKINEKGGIYEQYALVVDNYNTIYDALQKRKERLYYEMNSQLNFNTLTSLKKDTMFDYEKRKNLKNEYENINKNLTIVGNIMRDINSNKDLVEKINKKELTNLTYDNLKTLYIEMMSTIDTDRMASNWINTHYEQKIKESSASIKALGNRPPSSSGSKVTPTKTIEKHGIYLDNNSKLDLLATGSKIELSQDALSLVENDKITIKLPNNENKIEPVTKSILEWSEIFGVNEIDSKSNETILSVLNTYVEQVVGSSNNAKSMARDVNNFILFSKKGKDNLEIKPISVIKSFVRSNVKSDASSKVNFVEFTAPKNNTIIDKPLVDSFNQNPEEGKYGPKLITDNGVVLYNSTKYTENENQNYIHIQFGNNVYAIPSSKLLTYPKESYTKLEGDLSLIKMQDDSLAVIMDKGNILGTLLGENAKLSNIIFEEGGDNSNFIITYKVEKDKKGDITKKEEVSRNIILFKYKVNSTTK